jgi:hypothetical protein
MSRDLVTISARVDADSDLASELEEYQEQNSMTSKSEAVRHLLRSGLAQEMERPDDVVDDDRDAARGDVDARSSPGNPLNMTSGDGAIVLGGAFLIGSNNILAALTAVAGGMGAWVFLSMGLILSGWLLAEFAPKLGIEMERLGRQTGAE